MRLLIFGLLLLLAACDPGTDGSSSPGMAGLRYRAVLVAGDASVPAFDNATDAMRARLTAGGAAEIRRLTASRRVAEASGAGIAEKDQVLAAIGGLRPAAGQGCLVFVTSHGGHRTGLSLTSSRDFLSPAALDAALAAGCGEAPTIAILSGCFSGHFARGAMARPNRIVLTAARDDRPSFGCSAEYRYTFYDRCLLEAMDRAATWREAHAQILTCVSTRESAMGYRPSGPQAWFGDNVRGMPVPR